MRRLPAILILLACMLISACASLEATEGQTFEVRGDYVAAVEHTAKRRGVEIIWLNPPTQRRTRQLEWSQDISVEFDRDPEP